MNLRVYQRHNDWFLLGSALALLLIGAVAIYSATRVSAGDATGFFDRHLVYLGLGGGVFLFFYFLPLRIWEDAAYVVYGASLLFLVVVLLFGIDTYGAQRWFALGPLRVQPSEFAKIALVAVLARYLASKRVDLARPGALITSFALVLAPMVLVLRQPDLGTAAAFPALALPMLLWAGIPRLLLFFLLSPLLGLVLI